MATIVMGMAALLGGSITFFAWLSHGVLLALLLAPFGGSASALIAALTLPAKEVE
jgi:hypothetical protein